MEDVYKKRIEIIVNLDHWLIQAKKELTTDDLKAIIEYRLGW